MRLIRGFYRLLIGCVLLLAGFAAGGVVDHMECRTAYTALFHHVTERQ